MDPSCAAVIAESRVPEGEEISCLVAGGDLFIRRRPGHLALLDETVSLCDLLTRYVQMAQTTAKQPADHATQHDVPDEEADRHHDDVKDGKRSRQQRAPDNGFRQAVILAALVGRGQQSLGRICQ